MFIPTAPDNADKSIENIQENKEKISINPFEADLLQMAEMIAEDAEREKTHSHGGRWWLWKGYEMQWGEGPVTTEISLSLILNACVDRNRGSNLQISTSCVRRRSQNQENRAAALKEYFPIRLFVEDSWRVRQARVCWRATNPCYESETSWKERNKISYWSTDDSNNKLGGMEAFGKANLC